MHHVRVQQAEEHVAGYATEIAEEWSAEPAARHGAEESTGGHHVQIPRCGPGWLASQ